jgi:hypothetical protein
MGLSCENLQFPTVAHNHKFIAVLRIRIRRIVSGSVNSELRSGSLTFNKDLTKFNTKLNILTFLIIYSKMTGHKNDQVGSVTVINWPLGSRSIIQDYGLQYTTCL